MKVNAKPEAEPRPEGLKQAGKTAEDAVREKERELILPDEAEYPRELTEAYELLERMSGSRETETLLARDRRTGEKVTVKCFPADHPLYGQQEPEVLRNLDAPPLPRFVAEFRNEKMRCVLRQYAEGESLAERAARQPLTDEEIRELGIRLCDQLQALHGTNPPVIHRDVKPQNIILREDGTPVLIDFGISRVQSARDTDTLILGTKGFAPPEQYGFARTDARSDIYGLGMVLHWLQKGDCEIPESAGTPLEKVIRRMTAFDPRQRYENAAQARRALENTRPGNQRRRKITAIFFVALAVICLAAGVIAGLGMRNRRAEIADPLIAEAVRKNLGLAENAAITRDHLDQVTGIYIVADSACANPESFYEAISQWYSEGRPARGTMTNLADLAAMPNLEQVCVAAQQLEDISGLSGLRNLNKVEFKHNHIQDIFPLAGMDHLSSVGLNDNPVRDLSPLLECPSLAFLDLCDVRNYNPEIIGRMGNFDYLDISNPTESYRYLGQKSVLALAVTWTGLNSLEDLSGLTRLQDLDISHTNVSDLSPISCHSGLRNLKMSAVPVKDLSPLLSLPQLESVTLSKDMEPLLEGLGTYSFEIRYE